MTQSLNPTVLPSPLPDHTQLPEENGEFVKNFQEHPQSILLTDSLSSVLERLHPDGQYAIGQDCGIYWRQTDPPERGAEAPDWFYVPGVPPKLDGRIRRSYVLWQEFIAPSIVLEFAYGDGSSERDTTPLLSGGGKSTRPGKFWVYERIMRVPYYGIYQITNEQLEVYRLIDGIYRKQEANMRDRYPIDSMGIELGLWEGQYQNQMQHWLRWWDREGNLLLTGREQAEVERQRAEQERQRAERAEQSQQEAVPKLLDLGLTVEQVAETLNLSAEEVRRVAQQ